jgi:acetyl esterase/lipase
MNGSKRKGFKANLDSCAVTATYVDTGFKALQTNNLPKAHDSWISPIQWSSQLMKQLPPIFVSHGGEETLVEEGVEFIKKAKNNGVTVQHYVKEGYPHDFQVLPWFPNASKELYTAVGQFVRKQSAAK